MLKLQFKDQRRAPFWVIEKQYSIGSDAGNHLVLDDAGVDPLHARLVNSGDRFYLKDNNSRTGCFVNDQRITQKELMVGDLIRVGPVELEVLEPRASTSHKAFDGWDHWRLVADGSWLAGQSFVIPPDRPAVVGRAAQCDIVIPGTHLSRRHAELAVLGSSLRVKDLNSANGTFINEQPITETLAHSGDQLRIDVYRFRILGPEADPSRTRLRPVIATSAPQIPPRHTPHESKPRRWKTRPTSPGNREEPTYRDGMGNHWFWLLVIVLSIALIGAFYVL
jgi:pSer/pThr/pTyr-binding forkhead associated (FHA) protein